VDNQKIWSGTNEFFSECPATIIGVTGTKGKGTVATMICDIVEADGQTVHLLGNIGVSALEVLPNIKPDDVVVFELSSFQLWDAERSPHIAVVLRIEADHLDVHTDMADYVAAKSNITRHQTADDTVVFYEKNDYSRQIAELSAGQKVPYPADITFDTSVLTVPGAHYVENATAAIAATRGLLKNQASIEQGLGHFRSMPHRLELTRELHGVQYYDDNFSSSFPSLDVAIKAFPGQRILLIAGGKDRGLNNFADIAAAIDHSTVEQVFLIGQTAPKLAELLQTEYHSYDTLPEAVTAVHQAAQPGDVVLMSPGAPSFDMFRNFYDRGQQFQEIVRSLS
jgi:UDP-N-acetylmuramoylalanine--D-glutamate ligase